MSDAEREKHAAARAALAFVEPGMRLGLGTGSTAALFVRALAERGFDGPCVATSAATERLALALGLDVRAPDSLDALDLCIDGADEADQSLRLIKGGGGALLREKLAAEQAARFVVVADSSKLVARLGRFPLPVEVTPFGWRWTAARVAKALKAAGCERQVVSLRTGADGAPFLTDGGNCILDCQCQSIPDPEGLAAALKGLTGVVEHGLFLGLAHTLVIGRGDEAELAHRPG